MCVFHQRIQTGHFLPLAPVVSNQGSSEEVFSGLCKDHTLRIPFHYLLTGSAKWELNEREENKPQSDSVSCEKCAVCQNRKSCCIITVVYLICEWTLDII